LECAYTAIRNNNIFLKNINPTIGNANKVKRLTAEIRFLRAYFYAELIARYGGVPLLKEPFKLNDDFNVTRASFEECTKFVVDELNLAIPDLPNRNESLGANFGRVTKGAAIALKARTLLYAASPLFNTTNDKSKWQAVATACEELFNLKQYSLSADYKGLFLDPMNSENIFFKQFIGKYGEEVINKPSDSYYHYSGGHRIDEWRFPNGSQGWISENPLQNFVDQYETKSGHIPVLGYSGSTNNLQPILNPNASDYDPKKPYANRDPRLAYSVNYDGTIFQGRELQFWYGGKDSRDPNVDGWWNGSRLGYGIRKSLNEEWTVNSLTGSSQPWIYMRLAEFYLTYAEAQYHLNNTALAVQYVNLVRARSSVNMPPISSGANLLEKIKHERKIELAFEGNRWYDARRWRDAQVDFAKNAIGVEVIRNASTGVKTYRYFLQQQRSFPENHYLWPIPLEEILKSKIAQNPGY
jgi:starch-binding outer membrane protein, SusD/RagB family